MINVWGDFEHYASRRIWYLKSFREAGNRLPFIKTAKNGGIINFNEQREYHLQYVFKDYYGNKTVKDIYVVGTPQTIPPANPIQGSYALLTNRDNRIMFGAALLHVPGDLLARNTLLQPSQSHFADALSAAFRFAPLQVPLLDYTDLSIKVERPAANPQKYYIAARTAHTAAAEPARYCGGSFANGWVKGRVRELGLTYFIAYDDKAPNIHQTSANPTFLAFKLSDNQSGLNGYEAYIDDKFVLFEQGKDPSFVFCDLRKTPITPTKQPRTLKIMATDNRGNVAKYETKITY